MPLKRKQLAQLGYRVAGASAVLGMDCTDGRGGEAAVLRGRAEGGGWQRMLRRIFLDFSFNTKSCPPPLPPKAEISESSISRRFFSGLRAPPS